MVISIFGMISLWIAFYDAFNKQIFTRYNAIIDTGLIVIGLVFFTKGIGESLIKLYEKTNRLRRRDF